MEKVLPKRIFATPLVQRKIQNEFPTKVCQEHTRYRLGRERVTKARKSVFASQKGVGPFRGSKWYALIPPQNQVIHKTKAKAQSSNWNSSCPKQTSPETGTKCDKPVNVLCVQVQGVGLCALALQVPDLAETELLRASGASGQPSQICAPAGGRPTDGVAGLLGDDSARVDGVLGPRTPRTRPQH